MHTSRIYPRESLHFRTFLALSLLIVLVGASINAMAYTNLASAYAALKFDPNAPGNGVVVLLSDPHMNLDANVLPVTTNLNERLVEIVNAMTPAPEKMLVLGDVCTSLSPIPGWDAQWWTLSYGTNEMCYWNSSLAALTNVARSNILWIPGNHDQLSSETNAELFRLMFPSMPPYQCVEICGTRFVLLNTGNYGRFDDAQARWLKETACNTPEEMPLAVLTHVPPFHPAMNVYYRGIGPLLREALGQRTNKWRIFSGHFHDQSAAVYRVGHSVVASQLLGTANTNNTNGRSLSSGFTFLCLSNGIAGIVYYHYRNGSYELLPEPNWSEPSDYVAAFETTEGLLWRRLKSSSSAPEVLSASSSDSADWFSYTTSLELSLPLNLHSNLASDFLLLSLSLDASTKIELSSDRMVWVSVPTPTTHSDFVYRIHLPKSIACLATGYVRITATGIGNQIGGWGLAAKVGEPLVTYPQLIQMQDQMAIAGRLFSVTNLARHPYSPPDKLQFSIVNGPSGSRIDPESGVLEWTPPAEAVGKDYEFSIAVADEGTPRMSSTGTFAVSVLPSPPEVLSCFYSGTNWIMNIKSDPTAGFRVLRSTNLVDWEVWLSVPPSAGIVEIKDNAVSDRVFYRVVLEP